MARSLLYELPPVSKNNCLTGILALWLNSVDQSREYDLVNVSVSHKDLHSKMVQSCRFRWLKICPNVYDPFLGRTELIECIPLDTGASEFLLAAVEVRHCGG